MKLFVVVYYEAGGEPIIVPRAYTNSDDAKAAVSEHAGVEWAIDSNDVDGWDGISEMMTYRIEPVDLVE